MSWGGQPAAPQVGQAKRLPAGKSIWMSIRPAAASNSLPVTVHGGVRPSAISISVVSRMVYALHSARPDPSLAPCSPPSTTPRAGRGSLRQLLTAAARDAFGVVRPDEETARSAEPKNLLRCEAKRHKARAGHLYPIKTARRHFAFLTSLGFRRNRRPQSRMPSSILPM